MKGRWFFCCVRMFDASGFLCGLEHTIMNDPVIVHHGGAPPDVVVGVSYERAALERWIEADDARSATRYGPNPALKAMIDLMFNRSRS